MVDNLLGFTEPADYDADTCHSSDSGQSSEWLPAPDDWRLINYGSPFAQVGMRKWGASSVSHLFAFLA